MTYEKEAEYRHMWDGSEDWVLHKLYWELTSLLISAKCANRCEKMEELCYGTFFFLYQSCFSRVRRFRIWELHQQGWKQRAIATALGITQGAVSQTLARVKTGEPMR